MGDARQQAILETAEVYLADLDALERMYRDFLDQLPRALRPVANCSTSPAEAFQQYLLTIAAWRRLPIADPGLPDDLLPPQWSGKQAVALVQSAHERLAARLGCERQVNHLAVMKAHRSCSEQGRAPLSSSTWPVVCSR